MNLPAPTLSNAVQPLGESAAPPAKRVPANPPHCSARITQQTRNRIHEATRAMLQDSDNEVKDLLDEQGEADNEEHANLASGEEPCTYQQVMSLPDRAEWEQAMCDELDSIMQLGMYKLTELPPNHQAIDTKWVYCIKRDLNGNIMHYKARLVTKGFTQKPGINFDETYAPVTKIESI